MLFSLVESNFYFSIDILLGELRDGCQLLLPDLQGIYNNLSYKYDGSRVLFQTPSGINIAQLLTDLTEYKEIKRIDRKRWLRNTKIKVTNFGEDNR